MIRSLLVNALYAYAKAVSYVADWLGPADDGIWRTRQWREWDSQRRLKQREYQRFYRCLRNDDARKP